MQNRKGVHPRDGKPASRLIRRKAKSKKRETGEKKDRGGGRLYCPGEKAPNRHHEHMGSREGGEKKIPNPAKTLEGHE